LWSKGIPLENAAALQAKLRTTKLTKFRVTSLILLQRIRAEYCSTVASRAFRIFGGEKFRGVSTQFHRFIFLNVVTVRKEVAEKVGIGFELPPDSKQRFCTQCTQEVDQPSVVSVP
jgi:hypothetical protein